VDAAEQKAQFDVQLDKANADAYEMKAAFDKVIEFNQHAVKCPSCMSHWLADLLCSRSWMLRSRRHSLTHNWTRPMQMPGR
jgi:hypothetical protein